MRGNVNQIGDAILSPEEKRFLELEQIITNLRPNPEDFEGIISSSVIKRDLEQLEAFHQTPAYKASLERDRLRSESGMSLSEQQKKSVALEHTFLLRAHSGPGGGDWFEERSPYIDLGRDNPGYRAVNVVPTSEIDDTFNHADLVVTCANRLTTLRPGEQEPQPPYIPFMFAIDMTLNISDKEKLEQKFGWKHLCGKANAAVGGVSSEFGTHRLVINEKTGEEEMRTNSLNEANRNGLHIPGFTQLKYFEEKNQGDNPTLRKNRYILVPRFVVGYSDEITEILKKGEPERPADNPMFTTQEEIDSYRLMKGLYDEATMVAKFCTLYELKNQSANIYNYVDKLMKEQPKLSGNQLVLFKGAKNMAYIANRYFSAVLEAAEQDTKHNPRLLSAKNKALSDPYYQAIMHQSNKTFQSKQFVPVYEDTNS